MGGRRAFARWLLVISCLAALPANGALVDFESIPAGTIFGRDADNQPGEKVLTQDGIAMRLDILLVGSFVGFNRATVGGAYAALFDSTPLELNNISVIFDFTNLGFGVDRLSLEVQHFGGVSNLSVNGASLRDLLLLNDVPQVVAPDVSAYVVNDRLTLEGPLDLFRIGGQELVIDNVLAVPEPTTALLALLILGWVSRRPTKPTRRSDGGPFLASSKRSD